MSVISVVVLVFAILGAADFLLGNKFGIGKEFEKAFSLFCPMALSMLGMLVVAPALGVWLTPLFDGFYRLFGIDPSIIPASMFANDMGGMTLSQAVCKNEAIGGFNAFITSSMLGCAISFTLPFSIGLVKKEQHKELFFGMLCGIVTVPVGCLVAGLWCGLPFGDLLLTLLPLLLFGVVVGGLLWWIPTVCIRVFSVFGTMVKIVGVTGLLCAVFTFLTDIEISPHFDTLENASLVCVNACVTLAGMLPLMFIVSKLLDKPMSRLGGLLGINGISAIAFLSSTVTNATTFGVMDKMNRKGAVLNSAFAVSASFTFGSHLAFTVAFNDAYLLPKIVGKLLSGVCAVVLALCIYREQDDGSKNGLTR